MTIYIKLEDVEKSYADVLDLTSLKVQQVIETMNSLKESYRMILTLFYIERI
jgi:RNA polymerase sigma-70 factor (ECF subfamily)